MQSQQPHSVKPNVAFSDARVSTKENYVDASRLDPDTDILDRCGLYVDVIPPHLVAFGRVYEGSSIVPHMPLANDMVNVGVEEVWDANVHVSIPIEEVYF